MPTETRIWLVRHGETVWNALGRWQGHANVPLSAMGQSQAQQLAAHLAGHSGQFAALYTSDLARCAETATILNASLCAPVLQPDLRLRELNLGQWQGLTGDEIKAWDPHWWGILHSTREAAFNIPRPGGESVAQVFARALACLNEIAALYAGNQVLAITHGGVIRILMEHLAAFNYTPRPIQNTSITILRHSDGQWLLDSYNQADHLDAATSGGE
jgi:2,3-bisphosphoglycerate-dependent phosphoglycerate mutase